MYSKWYRKTIAVFAAAMLLLTGLPVQMAVSAEGEQDFSGYTAVSTKEELDAVRNDLGGKYYLTQDIVFTEADFSESGAFYNEGAGWTPITSFTGTFDGNGHTIIGLYVSITDSNPIRAGLFGCNLGTIQNLGMVDCNVSLTALRDPELSINTGDYSPLKTSLDIYMAGSIAGENVNNGIINNCYNTGSVTASVSYSDSGRLATTFYNAGVGGIVGCNDGTLSNCYNTGAVTPSLVMNAGGIAGENNGIISKCYNTANMTLSSHAYNAGGITGENNDTINDCYNTGNLIVSFSYINPGGITGNNNGAISNCYNAGDVVLFSKYTNGGGITGTSKGTITNCYYFDINETGVGNGTDTAISCTEAQLQLQTTFTGFDFENVWELTANSDYPCPTLKATPHVEAEENTTEFSGGNGTYFNPYIVTDKEELNAVRNYLYAAFRMDADIVFTQTDFAEGGAFYNGGAGWNPIAVSGSVFTGVFDGNGHTITGLYVNIVSLSNDYAGLFGNNNGTIKNLGLLDGSVNTISSLAGGIAGYSSGTVINCYNKNSVSANSSTSGAYSGGIVGYNFGKIIDCYNTGSINTASSSNIYVGGIAGDSGVEGVVINCYNTGTVNAISSASTTDSNYAYVGGIVGNNRSISGYNSTIINCYNTGSVNAASSSAVVYVGGIAGNNNSNEGGYNIVTNSIITNCYNIGILSANSSSAYIGGIAGRNSGIITNGYYVNYISKGVGNGADTAESCTEKELKTQATFVGFDFSNVWVLSDEGEYLFPTFKTTAPIVKSISITTLPGKLTYTSGTALDTTGMVLALTYDNGLTESVTSGWGSVYDLTVHGEHTVTISYGGKTTTFDVNVISKSLTGIEITAMPNKLTYFQKDFLDTTGMVLKATYNDNSTATVTSGWSSVYDFSTPGTCTVKIYYGGISVTFDVTVQTFYGDVDSNGVVTAADALLALQASVGKTTFTAEQAVIADVDGNGEVTAADALLILQYSVIKIDSFPDK